MEEDVVRTALDSFEANKLTADKRAAECERSIKQLKRELATTPPPRVWQFRLRLKVSRLGKELAAEEAALRAERTKVGRYHEAIEGIKRRDYEPAIKAIEEIAIPTLRQAAREMPAGVLFGPGAMIAQVQDLKRELIALSEPMS